MTGKQNKNTKEEHIFFALCSVNDWTAIMQKMAVCVEHKTREGRREVKTIKTEPTGEMARGRWCVLLTGSFCSFQMDPVIPGILQEGFTCRFQTDGG